MTVGFVLVTISPDHKYDVCKRLLNEGMVTECNSLHACEYDLLVKIKGNNYDEIGEFVIGKIKTIEGVIDTRTLLGTLMR